MPTKFFNNEIFSDYGSYKAQLKINERQLEYTEFSYDVSYTLYIIQLSAGDQQHTPITGYNTNSYTNLNVHATMLNMCSVHLSHCSYGNELCDTILGAYLHLSEEKITKRIYKGWLLVEVNAMTVFIPISTLIVSCTVTISSR